MTSSISMEKNGIGYTDAHFKNFSLLYSPDLRTLQLAPAYGLSAAAIYPTTRELSLCIGGAATLDEALFLDFITGKQS